MIQPLNPAASGYDPALELLALLSSVPAPLKCLREDLGLRHWRELVPLRRDAIERLGVAVDAVWTADLRQYVIRSRDDARRAAELAGEYYDRVYGDAA